jgi:Beige/BEACH domain/Concanavalin A-like lectin/glucanases superfamily/PH domain associated with Beige/BEACH/Neurobeachin/BDCP, DUF4704 alpha solenoid region/WD domain, G-beta repeat
MNAAFLRRYYTLVLSVRENRSLCSAMIDALASMASSAAPCNVYLQLDGAGAGLALSELSAWPTSGYTLSAWLHVDEFPVADEPRLFSFLNEDGSGVELFFSRAARGFALFARTKSSTSAPMTCEPLGSIDAGRWHCVTLTQDTRFLGRSTTTLYVDGVQVGSTTRLGYPATAKPMCFARIGANAVVDTAFLRLTRVHSLRAKLGMVHIVGGALSANAVGRLARVRTADDALDAATRHSLLLALDPRDADVDRCGAVARFLPGVERVERHSARDVLFCAGGPSMLVAVARAEPTLLANVVNVVAALLVDHPSNAADFDAHLPAFVELIATVDVERACTRELVGALDALGEALHVYRGGALRDRFDSALFFNFEALWARAASVAPFCEALFASLTEHCRQRNAALRRSVGVQRLIDAWSLLPMSSLAASTLMPALVAALMGSRATADDARALVCALYRHLPSTHDRANDEPRAGDRDDDDDDENGGDEDDRTRCARVQSVGQLVLVLLDSTCGESLAAALVGTNAKALFVYPLMRCRVSLAAELHPLGVRLLGAVLGKLDARQRQRFVSTASFDWLLPSVVRAHSLSMQLYKAIVEAMLGCVGRDVSALLMGASVALPALLAPLVRLVLLAPHKLQVHALQDFVLLCTRNKDACDAFFSHEQLVHWVLQLLVTSLRRRQQLQASSDLSALVYHLITTLFKHKMMYRDQGWHVLADFSLFLLAHCESIDGATSTSAVTTIETNNEKCSLAMSSDNAWVVIGGSSGDDDAHVATSSGAPQPSGGGGNRRLALDIESTVYRDLVKAIESECAIQVTADSSSAAAATSRAVLNENLAMFACQLEESIFCLDRLRRDGDGRWLSFDLIVHFFDLLDPILLDPVAFKAVSRALLSHASKNFGRVVLRLLLTALHEVHTALPTAPIVQRLNQLRSLRKHMQSNRVPSSAEDPPHVPAPPQRQYTANRRTAAAASSSSSSSPAELVPASVDDDVGSLRAALDAHVVQLHRRVRQTELAHIETNVLQLMQRMDIVIGSGVVDERTSLPNNESPFDVLAACVYTLIVGVRTSLEHRDTLYKLLVPMLCALLSSNRCAQLEGHLGGSARFDIDPSHLVPQPVGTLVNRDTPIVRHFFGSLMQGWGRDALLSSLSVAKSRLEAQANEALRRDAGERRRQRLDARLRDMQRADQERQARSKALLDEAGRHVDTLLYADLNRRSAASLIDARARAGRARFSRTVELNLALSYGASLPYGVDSAHLWKLASAEDFERRRFRLKRDINGASHEHKARRHQIEAQQDEQRRRLHALASSLPPIKASVASSIGSSDDNDNDGNDDDDDEDEEWHVVDEQRPENPLNARSRAERTLVARDSEMVRVDSVTCGRLEVTTSSLYFFSGSTTLRDKRFALSQVVDVQKRRYKLRDVAIEIESTKRSHAFFAFASTAERDDVLRKLQSSLEASSRLSILPGLRRVSNFLLAPRRDRLSRLELTRDWVERRISNFAYLMRLNSLAGRSYNDLTQYPVFPWVLADYTSERIDLSSPNVYRDLSKPVGALNPERLAMLRERYAAMEATYGELEGSPPPFLYGSHYSSSGIVLFYLLRLEPFTTQALELQGTGYFDHADRLFSSVAECYHGCLHSSADFKELTPEFFYLSEFLRNERRIDFGARQNGARVDDVVLPPWAHGSADEFVRINREALESDHVSANLHHWIDLVFGCAQRGDEALRADNVFHHLTYEGAVDLDALDDMQRAAIESQIVNFGQTPAQLFAEPHPRRRVSSASSSAVAECKFGVEGRKHAVAWPARALAFDDGRQTLVLARADGSHALYRYTKPDRGGGSSSVLLEASFDTDDGGESEAVVAPTTGFAIAINEDTPAQRIVIAARGLRSPADPALSVCTLGAAQSTSAYRPPTRGHHKQRIVSVAVDPSGCFAMTGSADCTAAIWKLAKLSDNDAGGDGDNDDDDDDDDDDESESSAAASSSSSSAAASASASSLLSSIASVSTTLIASTSATLAAAAAASAPLRGKQVPPPIDADRAISQWTRTTMLRWHSSPVTACALADALDCAVSASARGAIALFRRRRGTFVRATEHPSGAGVDLLEMVPSRGQFIAYSAAARQMATFTVNAQLLITSHTGSGVIRALHASSSGRFVVSGGSALKVWRTHNLEPVFISDLSSSTTSSSTIVSSLAMSSDERTIFCGVEQEPNLMIFQLQDESPSHPSVQQL